MSITLAMVNSQQILMNFNILSASSDANSAIQINLNFDTVHKDVEVDFM